MTKDPNTEELTQEELDQLWDDLWEAPLTSMPSSSYEDRLPEYTKKDQPNG